MSINIKNRTMSYLETEINEESVNEHFYKEKGINLSEEESEDYLVDNEENVGSTNEQNTEEDTEVNSETGSEERHLDKSNISFGRGFGGCYKCACKAFEGNGDICGNCYRHYDDHC